MNTTAVENRKRQTGNDISGFFGRDFLKRKIPTRFKKQSQPQFIMILLYKIFRHKSMKGALQYLLQNVFYRLLHGIRNERYKHTAHNKRRIRFYKS